MLYHCTSPDSFLFHTYTIQSQSQFNLNKIYFSCSNQIYADSHNRLSCLERLLRQVIDNCSVLPILFSLCCLSCVGGLTHGIPFLLYIRYPPSFLFELLDNLSKSCSLVLCPWKDKKRAFMLLHINALTLFYYKIVLSVVPYKLEVVYFFEPLFLLSCFCFFFSFIRSLILKNNSNAIWFAICPISKLSFHNSNFSIWQTRICLFLTH